MILPEIEMVPLSKIKDNPWRDKKRNPINQEKVEQISESIVTTGEFWVGVYGRRIGNFVELAFGHHRADAAKAVDTGDVIEAAKAAGLNSIPVAIREFTDGEMLMRMTRENMRGELPVVLEAVSAVVRALAEGKIEVPAPDAKTRKELIRHAPSFVPGRSSTSEVDHPYTADSLARTLGGVYLKKTSNTAQNSVIAALGILELEEKKIQGFTERVYSDKSIREIIPMVSDIKQRTEAVQERRGKTAAELSELREKQLAAQKKAKEDEDKADAARKVLVRSMAEAKRAENEKKQDRIAAEIKEKDERAKAKEALHQQRIKELDAKIAAVKAWEAEQRVEDTYAPIRRDVEAFISKYETKISERNPEREAIKSLATRKELRPIDRTRAQKALREYANWLYDWALPQLAPELKVAQKVAVEKRKATILRTEGSGA